MLFFGAKKGVVDIGSSAIKLVELRERKGELHLQRGGIEPLPPKAIIEGSIMDSSSVVDAIHRLNDQTKVKGSNYVTSLSGQSVIIKKIQFLTMTEEELASSIQWEAEQHIPFDINDVRLDYMVLTEGEPGQDSMEVLLVAVKRDKVNYYISFISHAGKQLALVDIDAFTVQNAYEVSHEIPPCKVVMRHYHLLAGHLLRQRPVHRGTAARIPSSPSRMPQGAQNTPAKRPPHGSTCKVGCPPALSAASSAGRTRSGHRFTKCLASIQHASGEPPPSGTSPFSSRKVSFGNWILKEFAGCWEGCRSVRLDGERRCVDTFPSLERWYSQNAGCGAGSLVEVVSLIQFPSSGLRRGAVGIASRPLRGGFSARGIVLAPVSRDARSAHPPARATNRYTPSIPPARLIHPAAHTIIGETA